MDWATLWAIFSQTHLVALAADENQRETGNGSANKQFTVYRAHSTCQNEANSV
jgi:hypothetical protein